MDAPHKRPPHGVVRSVTLGAVNVSVQILPPSDKRTTLIFGPPNVAGKYTLTTDPTAVTDAGITMWNVTSAVELTCERHGDIVRKAWYAIPGQTGTVVGFVEVVEE